MLRGLDARLALIHVKVAQAAGCDFNRVCEVLLADAQGAAYVLGRCEATDSAVPPLFWGEPLLIAPWDDGQADRIASNAYLYAV